MGTAIIYTRVSTEQQVDGSSLDGQERALTDTAIADGYTPLVISDPGRSGKSISGRPGLQRALDMLQRKQADALYVAKLDRLSRSAVDALQIADQASKYGWRLIALDLALDTGTPVGRLVLTMLSAVAEMERNRIAERHRDWHAEHRQQGKVWGKTEGYRSPLDPNTRSYILQLRDQGLSYRAIADRLTAENIPTVHGGQWHASTVSRVVKSPINA